MIIDVHCHIFSPAMIASADEIRAKDPWFAACHQAGTPTMATVDELIAYMDEAGVHRAVVLGWPFASRTLTREMNDTIADAVKRFPGRLVGFGVVLPRDPGAVEELARFAELGLKGVGEMNADAQSFHWDDWDLLEPLVNVSLKLNLIWNIHCSEPVGHDYAGKGTATPDQFTKFLLKAKGLRVICAHMGGGLPFYAQMPEVRELCQRVWFDTAAVPYLYETSVYQEVITKIGNRVLFGSDFPLLRAANYMPTFAQFPPQVGNQITGLAAELLFQDSFQAK